MWGWGGDGGGGVNGGGNGGGKGGGNGGNDGGCGGVKASGDTTITTTTFTVAHHSK